LRYDCQNTEDSQKFGPDTRRLLVLYLLTYYSSWFPVSASPTEVKSDDDDDVTCGYAWGVHKLPHA